MDPTEVFGDLRAVLTRLEAAAIAAERSLPERRFVAVGGVVYDCEQVSVLATSVSTGIVGAVEGARTEMAPCPPVRQITAEIAIVRMSGVRYGGPRTNQAPTVLAIETDAEDASRDMALLFDTIAGMSGFAVGEAGTPNVEFAFQRTEGGLRAVIATATFNIGWL